MNEAQSLAWDRTGRREGGSQAHNWKLWKSGWDAARIAAARAVCGLCCNSEPTTAVSNITGKTIYYHEGIASCKAEEIYRGLAGDLLQSKEVGNGTLPVVGISWDSGLCGSDGH